MDTLTGPETACDHVPKRATSMSQNQLEVCLLGQGRGHLSRQPGDQVGPGRFGPGLVGDHRTPELDKDQFTH